MGTVMLDTNCLIDLENGTEPQAGYLRRVLAADIRRELEVVVGAIVASENARPGEEPSWAEFEALCQRAGVADAKVLPTLGYWGVMYWGHALWSDEDSLALEARIHAVLAPGLAMDDQSDMRKWLNVKCDVLTVWTHVFHKTDALVTNDRRLYNKAHALTELGANVKRLSTFAADLKG